jgi:hypothetical protein
MESRQQEGQRYLAKAKEAEAAAANITDFVTRVDWLKIAAAYRILFKHIQHPN